MEDIKRRKITELLDVMLKHGSPIHREGVDFTYIPVQLYYDDMLDNDERKRLQNYIEKYCPIKTIIKIKENWSAGYGWLHHQISHRK